MATTSAEPMRRWTGDIAPVRCPDCRGSMLEGDSALECATCGTVHPIRDGILVVKDQPTEDNRIAADFYNGPLWPAFRFWERFFWVCNGGERRARRAILDHLPRGSRLRLLDVAIGDGVYTSWLPSDWSITGIDVSTAQLAACAKRNAARDPRLILGEAENLPFADATFDVILSIGGFNHFNDPELALREMARVATSGSLVVVSDEMPDLTERMIGHRMGWPGLDRWIVARLLRLGDDFTDLVERHRRLDIAAIGRAVLQDCEYRPIWRGGGYVLVGKAP